MLLTDNVRTGDRVEIADNENPAEGKMYLSVVEKVLDNNMVAMHAPISSGKLIMLSKEVVHSFLFYTAKAMLRFDARIIEYKKEDGFDVLYAQMLSNGERVQRREFFRASCNLPFRFGWIVDPYDFDGIEMFKGLIKDIGGGGMRFTSNADLEEGSMILSDITLNNFTLAIDGKILHKQDSINSNDKYQYRAEFVNISETEREKILQYILEEQRGVIRKTRATERG